MSKAMILTSKKKTTFSIETILAFGNQKKINKWGVFKKKHEKQ